MLLGQISNRLFLIAGSNKNEKKCHEGRRKDDGDSVPRNEHRARILRKAMQVTVHSEVQKVVIAECIITYGLIYATPGISGRYPIIKVLYARRLRG